VSGREVAVTLMRERGVRAAVRQVAAGPSHAPAEWVEPRPT
jgi:hypothetical protein